MRKLISIALLALLLATGCAQKDEPTTQQFNDFASTFHAQMFTDGEQSELVDVMYTELVADFKDYEGSELYDAISGMYHGLNNGNATKYQLETMRLLNEL